MWGLGYAYKFLLKISEQNRSFRNPMCKVKVKQSVYRPEQALSVQVGLGSQISKQSALRNGRIYSPGNIAGTHFCNRLSRSQDHGVVEKVVEKFH